jgi:hypothetical protein
MKQSDWDIDLRDGLAGENSIRELLKIETIEVKTDRRWKETGNLYIEIYCYQQKTQNWKKSGLAISKATHWAFPLGEATIIITKEALTKAVLQYGKKIECKIEPNPSRGYLIRPEELLAVARGTL